MKNVLLLKKLNQLFVVHGIQKQLIFSSAEPETVYERCAASDICRPY